MNVFYDRLFVVMVPVMILGLLLGSCLSYVELIGILGLIISLLGIFVSIYLEDFNMLVLPALLLGSFSLGVLGTNKESVGGNLYSLEHLNGVGKVLEVKEGAWKQAVIQCKYKLNGKEKENWEEKFLAIIQMDNVCEGDIVMFSSDLYLIKNKNNPGEFNEELFWLRKGIRRRAFIQEQNIRYLYTEESGLISKMLSRTRNWISDQISTNLSTQNAALAHALLLGDKHLLKSEEKQVFSNAGAMHVLAVSGLHVGIIVYLLIAFLKNFKRFLSRYQIHLIALVFIWIYALLIDLPPSVNRSAMMFSILILGELIERKGNTLNLLFFAAFIQLLIDPYVIFDIGFQLSYLAMIGIICFYPMISKVIYVQNKIIRKGWAATSIGIAAQITTFPLTLYYFHQFPNYFVLSNLIVLLLAGVILGMGIIFILLIKVPFVQSLVTSLFGLSLSLLFMGMSLIESMPGAVARGFEFSISTLVLIYLFIFAVIILKGMKHFSKMVIIGIVAVLLIVQYLRFENWNDEHVAVFNFKRPLIAIHRNNATILLFDVRNDKELKGVNKIIDDYLKVYPGKIERIPIERDVNRVRSGDLKLYIENHNEILLYRSLSLEFAIRKSVKAEIKDVQKSFCLSYLDKRSGEISLDEGAYIFKL